ncbi:MAG: GNAT family N-acetyltransferase [Acutalibacter sp.]|nr:GNAT family N-acetyltransferase [Acutalibacter sp.]
MRGFIWKFPVQTTKSALAFRQEFFSSGEPVIFGSELLDQTERYEDWLDGVTKNADPETVSPGWVRTDTFFAVDGEDELVGIIDLCHTLNDFLADLGNCGYSVRPSQRQKGYAGQMLRQVLDRAKEVRLTALHISVERENIPSVKVIKSNGGVYQCSFTHEGQQADIYAFRI